MLTYIYIYYIYRWNSMYLIAAFFYKYLEIEIDKKKVI